MRKALSCSAVLILLLSGVFSASTRAHAESLAGPGAEVRALDPELTNYEYPFPVRYFEVDTQGQKLRMAYMDVASGKPNGRTVVLLHGKNFSGAYWAPTVKALTEAGFRVLAPDQIGFGKSAKPAAYQFSFQALAANTEKLLASLGIRKFVLVGHSMGGMLAVRMALMYPAQVEKLALVNPLGLEDWKLTVPYHTIDDNLAQELRATSESIRDYQRTNYFAGQWKPDYERLIEIPAGWTLHPEYRRVAWNAALTSDMVFTQPVLYEFAQVKAPTLLIIGQRDRTAIGKAWVSKEVAGRLGNYPVLGRAAAKRIPNARLIEISEAGHLPQVEAFQTYIRGLLDFAGAR